MYLVFYLIIFIGVIEVLGIEIRVGFWSKMLFLIDFKEYLRKFNIYFCFLKCWDYRDEVSRLVRVLIILWLYYLFVFLIIEISFFDVVVFS